MEKGGKNGGLIYSKGLSEATQYFTLSLPGEKEGAPRPRGRGRRAYRGLSRLLLSVRGLALSQPRDALGGSRTKP